MRRRARAFFCSLRSRRSRLCSSSSASAHDTRASKPATAAHATSVRATVRPRAAQTHSAVRAQPPRASACAPRTWPAPPPASCAPHASTCPARASLRAARQRSLSPGVASRVQGRTLFAVDVVQVGDGVAHHLAAFLAKEAGALLRVRVDQLLGAHARAQLRNVVALDAALDAQRLAHHQAQAVVHLGAPCLVRSSLLRRRSVRP